jgi:hypothetical protein
LHEKVPSSEPVWVTARACGHGNCVSVAAHDGHILIADTKSPSGPRLVFDAEEWATFLQGAKAGDFDNLESR